MKYHRLRNAWAWDRQLPWPVLGLLIAMLIVLVPIPFLLPSRFGEPERAAPPAVIVVPAPPAIIVDQRRDAAEATSDLPLLIDPVRFQDASLADMNTVALLLADAPILAQQTFAVGAGIRQPLAAIITGQALRWNLNPAVLVALLEVQSGQISNPRPTAFADALRGPASATGLDGQIEWAAIELREGLLEPMSRQFALRDGTLFEVPESIDQANYALLRFLSQTHSRAELDVLLGEGPRSWKALAAPMLGDPRRPMRITVGDRPFLTTPFTAEVRPVGLFDHHYPLVSADGAVVAADEQAALGYDGHNGWDYELPEQAPILAAAPGEILFAGWVDSGCASPAGVIVVQHSNGYRTSYWHLERLDVSTGEQVHASQPLGLNGASGCTESAHLHFSVQRLGRDVDPAGWCWSVEDPWAEHPAGAVSVWLWLDQVDPCQRPTSAIIVDEADPASAWLDGAWQVSENGNFSSAHWLDHASAALVRWRPTLPTAGTYRLLAFIPNRADDAATVEYAITHAGGISRVTIDQRLHAGSWVNLGSYRFFPGQRGFVVLEAAEVVSQGTIWADAIAWIPQ